MLEEAQALFQHVTREAHQLLPCSSVSLFLGCPDAALRHTLLDLLSCQQSHLVSSYGPISPALLLRDWRVHALCDVAIQKGQIQGRNIALLAEAPDQTFNVLCAPIERPGGVLGFLLLADSFPDTFSTGQYRLLRSYLPQVARQVEKGLRHMCNLPGLAQLATSSEPSPPHEHETAQMAPLQKLATAHRSDQRVEECAQELALVSQHLKELERLKHEFISMVSHELRTPLTAIKGYAVLLQAYGIPDNLDTAHRDELTSSRQREYLDIIMEQANHLEVLISDLLDISRIHAGRLALHIAPVDIVQLSQRVALLTQRQVDQALPDKYFIRCAFAPQLPPAFADADRVQQVLTNLLDNAVKYTPNGGLIEVIAQLASAPQPVPAQQSSSAWPALLQKPAWISITVRDQGIGIPVTEHEKLFQPFSRLQYPSEQRIPGVGLGLYITRRLVDAMHGQISLSSQEGAGTSVTVTLPAVFASFDTESSPGFLTAPATENAKLTLPSS